MSVHYIPCPSVEAVSEEAARWKAAGLSVKTRWNDEELQHEAVLQDPVGRTTAVAWFSPLDEAPGSAADGGVQS